MKNVFSKPLTFKEQSNINKVLLWLNFILLICALVMKWFGIYADFNSSSIFFLGMFLINAAFTFKDVKKRDLRTVLLAATIVGDAMYVIPLFFLLGRAFMQNL
ncbi:MAG: hypothetical protein HDT25_01535 [Ruminococcus sp.]|nr:hypothetical protein [Ruminococcus sp.]